MVVKEENLAEIVPCGIRVRKEFILTVEKCD